MIWQNFNEMEKVVTGYDSYWQTLIINTMHEIYNNNKILVIFHFERFNNDD